MHFTLEIITAASRTLQNPLSLVRSVPFSTFKIQSVPFPWCRFIPSNPITELHHQIASQILSVCISIIMITQCFIFYFHICSQAHPKAPQIYSPPPTMQPLHPSEPCSIAKPSHSAFLPSRSMALPSIRHLDLKALCHCVFFTSVHPPNQLVQSVHTCCKCSFTCYPISLNILRLTTGMLS